ncbi:aldehyde dehydrogenase [Iamia sp. SCSIO 61187]|uniref:aldehyde dehydrogenase n=1 Tax=Iamia sp. SCSIO 61187 TaxID=2722752 RepID=UPI001C628BDF|nr:aldehyde dehydrogenase [Iamia sp. SCSIO 61187]QYG92889.1 aldehyde dehydrogenase [Iamia sp. SCSIO 61187]
MADVIAHDSFLIGGDWVAPRGTGTIEVINPSTEEPFGRVPEGTTDDMDAAVAAARQAFDHGPWAQMSPKERGAVLAAVSGALTADMQGLAELISGEMGCPVSWGVMGQVFAATMIADQYVGLADTYEFTDTRAGMMGPSEVRKVPYGVVAAIVPWNVPVFEAMIKLAPALVAGNTVVLKPAPETPLSAQALGQIFQDAGLPPGVVNIVPAGREVGEHLVTHPGVDKVSFTGSTAAGRQIASVCGQLLRPLTLELGGKSAAIILDDVDLADVVAKLVPVGVMNNGQACVAQTRILASRDRYAEVVDAVSEAVGALTVGDALDPATEIGPLVAERQRERVLGYLDIGRAEGARVTVGGGRPAGLDKGWFVEPTVFADAINDMRIAQEEIFGPVLTVIPYDDVEDAVRIANDSPYGLSGSVWGGDHEAAASIARRIQSGTVNVNTFTMDMCSPFGGFKASGMGRELGPEGLEAFLQTQTVAHAAQG